MQSQPKAIAAALDRRQSQLLVQVMGGLLALDFVVSVPLLSRNAPGPSLFLLICFVSLTFGVLVWALRAATPAAAIFGAIICQLITAWTAEARHGILHTALTPLMLLFALTFVATRLSKRHRPKFTSASESRRARTASQIIANLGFSALLVFNPAALLAALAEATADTVSSELGQAFGGMPYLLTNFRPAPAGTDGAVSLLGTTYGILAAMLVTAAGAWSMHLNLRKSLAALVGAVGGLFFDSLLGATVERRGWLNNDLVNFSSTAFAAAVTLLLLVL